MINLEKYYENTENILPNPLVRKFIKMNIKPTNAIDLGCGAGRDTVYLIKNGWKVLSIDRENTEKYILSKLNNEEVERFRFERQDFENIELEKNNLLVANFSIPFCNSKSLNEFWSKISDSILEGRILCGKLFGAK
jgi:SAM-dependent methyltransferase